MWTAFCADGTCLPPVVFVSKKFAHPHRLVAGGGRCWYTDGNRSHYAFVHEVDDASTNGQHTKQWWVDMVDPAWNFLEGTVALILDNAPWHTSAAVKRFLQEDPYSTVPLDFLPPKSGKWLNPNDQAIHHSIKAEYRRLARERPYDSLTNVIAAYYRVPDSTVTGSWKHTALLDGPIKATLTQRDSEGFHCPRGKEEEFKEYRKVFEDQILWKKRNVDALQPSQPFLQLGDTSTTGRYWRQPNIKKRPIQ